MTFCYIHRSLPNSAIIIEASSCSRWEQIQRPTYIQYTENEKPWDTQFHVGNFHGSGNPMNEESERVSMMAI